MKKLLTILGLTKANVCLHRQAFTYPIIVETAPEVRQAYLDYLSAGANSYDRYYPPYQLIPTNGTAQVKAKLTLTEFGQNFVHEDSVFFVTPTGLRYNATYEQPTKTYTITLSGAEDRTVTEVYAIAKRHPSDQSGDLKNYYTLGKIGLANYNTNHSLKLVLVNIDGQINATTAQEKLNQIYAPLGFSWEVSEDNGFDAGNAVSNDSLQFTGSSWLSQYTDGMKRLHAKYRAYKGDAFDESANYVFVMRNAGVNNLAGDMPRRSQFGYIFTDAGGDVYRTLAHELGHGKFTLMHPIDGAYGSLKDLPNLMNTTHINDTLAKWQWDILHDPAWLVIFDKDEEGMAQSPQDLGEEYFESKINEAVSIMANVQFGRVDRNTEQQYSLEYWEAGRCVNAIGITINPSLISEYSLWLSLKDGKIPSAAVFNIFDNPNQWSMDCAEFVQVVIWYGLLQRYGKVRFDEYIHSILNEYSEICTERFFTIAPHNSTGIIQDRKFSRYSSADEEFLDEYTSTLIEDSESQLLQQCAVGTRIAVKNIRAPEFSAYRYENAVKLGVDLYGAHGLGQSKLTMNELKISLGQMTYGNETPEFKSEVPFVDYINLYVFVCEIETYKTEIK